MTIKSIAHPDLLKIYDEKTQEMHYGGNQVWYKTKWQRLSGCGPTVAANLFYYLNRPFNSYELETTPISKEKWVSLMEDVWKFVTPSLRGVYKTKMFYEPMLAYTKFKGLNVQEHVLEIPKDKSRRPEFASVLGFLEEALAKDAPVAFLNLCNGEEKNLDRWHWVTLIALEYREDKNKAFASILDEGRIKIIDLGLWYHTTTLGGGFVYFTEKQMVEGN